MKIANIEVRQEIKKRRVRQFEVAEVLGVSQFTLSHWLQVEMSPERKKEVLKAIRNVK